MTNDLIFVDGQEGFIDLDFFIQMDISNNYHRDKDFLEMSSRTDFRNFDDSKLVKPLIETMDKDRKNGWLRVSSFHKIEYPFGRISYTNNDGVDLKRKLTVLDISRNNVSREFSRMSSPYDKTIDYWNTRIEYYRNIKRKNGNKKSCYRKEKIEECTRNIRRNFRLKFRNPWVSDYENEFGLVLRLVRRCPERFCSVFKDVFENENMSTRFDVYLLRVSSKIIPYLEQQLGLGRISLTEEEKRMLFSLKEAMRVKDNSTTFDSYIDNWAKKLMEGK